MIVHRDLKPANLMLGGIPHETGTREMVRFMLGFHSEPMLNPPQSHKIHVILKHHEHCKASMPLQTLTTGSCYKNVVFLASKTQQN